MWLVPLPSPLSGDHRSLSSGARAEIQALTGSRPFRFIVQLTLAWLTIAAVVWFASTSGSILVRIAAIVIVSSRQLLLGFLIHEQVHDLALPRRGGDLVVNLCAAFPLLVITVEGYTQVHLAHHKYYFTQADPDFVRKNGPDWAIPMTLDRLARLFLSDLLGLNSVRLIRGKRTNTYRAEFNRPRHPPLAIRIAFYVIAVAATSVLGGWPVVLIYWVLPLLTVTQALLRWGALCEHKYNLVDPEITASSPIIVLRWWERLILPNLNFTLHPYHHYFPGVPYVDLPYVHAIFAREGLLDRAKVFDGYGQYLRFILNFGPRATVREAYPSAPKPLNHP
jgi:fatty acid desaturase